MLKAIDYLKKGESSLETLEGAQNTKQIDSQIRFKRSDDNLKLPENFEIGQAIGGGDCFFDSIVQGLKRLKPETDFTVKSLREVCKRLAIDNQQLRDKVIRDAKNSYDPGVVLPDSSISDDELWNAYLVGIEYTGEDIDRMGSDNPSLYKSLTSLKYGSTLKVPIWGRPDIEGQLICNKYHIKLHVAEKLPHVGYSNQILDRSVSRSVDSVDYNDINTIHIVNRGNAHFEPILSTQGIQHNRQQSLDPSDYDTPEEELKISAEEEPKKKSQDSEQQSPGSSSDRLKRANNDPNAGSFQQSSSDSSQSGPSGDNQGSQPDDNLKPDTGEYPASGLKKTLHGNVYQLKLLMLFLNRATGKGYEFSLATEMKSAEKFDDLVFQYIDRNERKKVYRFLQAKHIDDSKKISENDLITEKDDKFSLQKYLISYKKIKKNIKFSGENNKLEDFVICTNIDFDQGLIKKDDTEPQTPKGKSPSKKKRKPQNLQFEEVSEIDNILGQEGKKYKITLGEEKDNPVIEILKNSSNLKRLTKKLANRILEGEEINLKDAISDGLFNSYHFILAKKIIDIENGKFKQEFFSSDEEDIKVFREAFLEAVLEQDLEIKEFEVAVGNKFNDEQINSVVEELVKKIKDNQEVEKKRITFNGRKYNTRSPDKNKEVIAHNPQIFQFIFTRKDRVYDTIDEETKYTQSFSDYFLNADTKLLEKFPYVKKIRDRLETKLSIKGISIESLKKYEVVITGDKFQFVKGSGFCLYSEEAVKNLLDMEDKLPTEKAELDMLAKALSGFLTNSQFDLDNIKRYYNFLLNQGIIANYETDSVKTNSKQDFLPSIKIKFNGEKLLNSGLGSHLRGELSRIFEKKSIKLSKTFGNTSPTITEEKKFIGEFVSLVKQSKDRIIEIEINENTFKQQNIDALAGHVLSIQDDKIKFSSDFSTREFPRPKKKDNPLKDLRDELKNNVPNFEKEFGNYQFEIEGFTCQSALPNDYITEDDVKEFFSKLRFAVNQPNEVELGKIIAKEMGEEFNLLDSDFIYSDFQRWMLDWFKEKEGFFLTRDKGETQYKGKRFFEEVRGKIAKLVSIGPTSLYHKKIERYDTTFNERKMSSSLKTFLDFGDDGLQVFDLIVEDTTLGAIEVYGALKVIDKYSKTVRDQDKRVFIEDSHIFLNLKNLLILQERVLQAFKSEKNDLLIIECKSTEVPKVDKLYEKLKEIIDGNPDKRIVLITKSDNDLAEKFFDYEGRKYKGVPRYYGPSHFKNIGKLLEDKLDSSVFESLEGKGLIKDLDKKPNELISLKVLSVLINSKTKIDRDYKYLDFYGVFSEHDKIEDIFKKIISLELPIDRTIAEYVTVNFIVDLLKKGEDNYKYGALRKLLFAETFKNHIYKLLEERIKDDDTLKNKWKEIENCDLSRGLKSLNGLPDEEDGQTKEKGKPDLEKLKLELEKLEKEFDKQPAATLSKIVKYLLLLGGKGLKLINDGGNILVLDPASNFKYKLSIEHEDKIISLINWGVDEIKKVGNLDRFLEDFKRKDEVQDKILEILGGRTELNDIKIKAEKAMKVKVARRILDSGVDIKTYNVQELTSELQAKKSLSLECLPGKIVEGEKEKLLVKSVYSRGKT